MSGGIALLTKRFQQFTAAVKEAEQAQDQFTPQAVADPLGAQTGPVARRQGVSRRRFGAGATSTGFSPVAGADVAESMEDFFRNSSIGEALRKIIEGDYAFGDVKAEDALDRILATMARLDNPGKTDPFYLADTLQKQLESFRTFFRSLGDPEALARALAEFRKRFPSNGTSPTTPSPHGTGTTGTLGTPEGKCCGSGTGLDIMKYAGGLR